MSAIALQALADETGGQLVGESVALQNLAIDSREVKAGDLFAALSGQRVDGHDFAPQALAAGASALLTERKLEGLSPQLVVADVLQASGRFGCLKRQAFEGDVIAITGSAGKTTTKNLVAAALATAGEVHATVGNQNNELGVPITLSGLTNNHRFGVIEMGAGQPGDIAYLCQLARPNVAVCLNASAAHLAHYASVDAIAATKGEIFEGLAGNGLAVINADQEWLPQWREQAGTARQVTFGLAQDADYRGPLLLRQRADLQAHFMDGAHRPFHLGTERPRPDAHHGLANAREQFECGIEPLVVDAPRGFAAPTFAQGDCCLALGHDKASMRSRVSRRLSSSLESSVIQVSPAASRLSATSRLRSSICWMRSSSDPVQTNLCTNTLRC